MSIETILERLGLRRDSTHQIGDKTILKSIKPQLESVNKPFWLIEQEKTLGSAATKYALGESIKKGSGISIKEEKID